MRRAPDGRRSMFAGKAALVVVVVVAIVAHVAGENGGKRSSIIRRLDLHAKTTIRVSQVFFLQKL
jgi:hypothetical protein